MAPVTVIFGTGGVGPAIARQLVGKGRKVHLMGRNEKALNELKEEFKCQTTVVDVMASDSSNKIKSAIESAEQEGGGIDGLVYAVGSIPLKSLKQTTEEDMMNAFKLNCVGAAESVKFAGPSLTKNKGSVVLFSTTATLQGFPHHVIISTVKGGVEAMTKSLASELAPHVRVNCISPGLLNSPLAKNLTKSESMVKALAETYPIPRLGEVDDVANMATFLLGKESGWITGQNFAVDGGRSTLRPKNQ
eukprot:TRINITY_DN9880_c0_g2_i1.p1 TRINITY_DN9880_c0_g2~~TRINITY_DN9880_c0_g2_i1.p1  ORF type:complete len:260 (-),score=67.42 TRINITY_DN9880_c0_g2_i1:48-788(-)